MQGDEISQAAQIEIEGVKFFIKGNMQVISWLSQALSALFDIAKDKIDHISGERSFQQILKLSQPDIPQTIYIDDKFKGEFFQYVKEKGLQYCLAIDFDLQDGKTPVIVPANQMSIYVTILDSLQKRKIHEEEAALNEVQAEIEELEEKLLTCNEKEILLLETSLENKIQAENELTDIYDDSLKYYEIKDYAITMDKYLASAKDTDFEHDPSKAVTEYNLGLPIVKDENVKECMQPVRSQFLLPTTKTQYYTTETGVTIERTYHQQDGIVYSDYSFKTEQGVIYEFTDKSITKEKWNSEILPKIFDAAGLADSIKCKVFETAKQADTYFKYVGKMTSLALAKKQQAVFNDAEVMKEAKSAFKDMLKGMASAKVSKDKIEFIVPQEMIFLQEGKVIYAPEGVEGALYKFEKVKPGEIKNGMISFSASKNEQVMVREKNKPEKIVSAEAVNDIIKNADNKTRNRNPKGR